MIFFLAKSDLSLATFASCSVDGLPFRVTTKIEYLWLRRLGVYADKGVP